MEIALSSFIFRYCNKNNHILADIECHPLNITPVTDPCPYKQRYIGGAWRFFSSFLNKLYSEKRTFLCLFKSYIAFKKSQNRPCFVLNQYDLSLVSRLNKLFAACFFSRIDYYLNES